MVPFPEWIAIIYVVYIELVLKCLSHKYIQETGSWRSTSDIIPKQSTSYGTIRLGTIMSIEFDFLFNGRSNDVVSCESMEPPAHGIRPRDYQENFFRIGEKSITASPSDCEKGHASSCYPSHFPSMWLGPLCSDNYLVVFFNSGYYTFPYVDRNKFEIQCYVHHESLKDYGTLSTTQWHHITIAMNLSQVVIEISGGGKPDYSHTIDEPMYPGDALGEEVPVWFMTDHIDTDTAFNAGDAIFSNIVINSSVFTWTPFPSESPTYRPTNVPTKVTVSPTSAPTYSPSFAPSEAPTCLPSSTPSYSPTGAPTFAPFKGKSGNIITIIKNNNDIRYFLLLLLFIPFIIFCCYRIRRYMSYWVVDKALVLIIGIAHFDGNELSTLMGIKPNVEELKELWSNMYHYTVKICNEETLRCNKKDVLQFIDINKAELNDITYKAVIVHILSHGSETDTFITSDLKVVLTSFIEHELISTAEFAEHPGLIKLIFHHACRGNADYFRFDNIDKAITKKRECCDWCIKSYRAPKIKDTINNLAVPLSDMSGADIMEMNVKQNMYPLRSNISGRNAIYPLRNFSDTFSVRSNTEEMDVHSNCVVLYGNIEDRCVSDGGQFTSSICRIFNKNMKEIIKPEFQTLIREIGNDMESKTNNAQICTSKGIGTLKKKIRFEQSKTIKGLNHLYTNYFK
eukprot:212294_1